MLMDSQRVHVQRQQYKFYINLVKLFEHKSSVFVVELNVDLAPILPTKCYIDCELWTARFTYSDTEKLSTEVAKVKSIWNVQSPQKWFSLKRNTSSKWFCILLI